MCAVSFQDTKIAWRNFLFDSITLEGRSELCAKYSLTLLLSVLKIGASLGPTMTRVCAHLIFKLPGNVKYKLCKEERGQANAQWPSGEPLVESVTASAHGSSQQINVQDSGCVKLPLGHVVREARPA